MKPHPPRKNSPFKPIWGLFAVLVVVSALTLYVKLVVQRDRVAWRYDFAAAMEESKRIHKPALLYFTATWCEPCQRMRGATWSDSDVASKLDAYVPVKIDIDRDPAIAMRYGVDPIPAFFVLDNDGKPIKYGDGFMDAATFSNWLSAPASELPPGFAGK